MILLCPKCSLKSEIEHVERGRHVECSCGCKFLLDDGAVLEDYSPIDETPPPSIGQYRIERFIGRGGMGRVYKGVHPTLGIPVAVKTLLAEYAQNADFKQRFIHSARICAKIDHPNMVRVYDFGSTPDGMLYLVMEYVPGGTVYDTFIRKGPLPPYQVAEIALAVANALAVAKTFGIVHRDVKPDNIMIAADGVYKLSDLGLAKQYPSDAARLYEKDKIIVPGVSETNPSLTQIIAIGSLGTPEYMSPEQSFNASGCDIRADIYSLGAALYQIASGRLPFQAPNTEELLRQHLYVQPKVPSEFQPLIPLELDYIIMRCLEKLPEDRYDSPEELHADLLAFLRSNPLPSTEPHKPKHVPSSHPVSGKTRVGCSAFLTILLLLFFVVGAWYVFHTMFHSGSFFSGGTPSAPDVPALLPVSPDTQTPSVSPFVSESVDSLDIPKLSMSSAANAGVPTETTGTPPETSDAHGHSGRTGPDEPAKPVGPTMPEPLESMNPAEVSPSKDPAGMQLLPDDPSPTDKVYSALFSMMLRAAANDNYNFAPVLQRYEETVQPSDAWILSTLKNLAEIREATLAGMVRALEKTPNEIPMFGSKGVGSYIIAVNGTKITIREKGNATIRLDFFRHGSFQEAYLDAFRMYSGYKTNSPELSICLFSAALSSPVLPSFARLEPAKKLAAIPEPFRALFKKRLEDGVRRYMDRAFAGYYSSYTQSSLRDADAFNAFLESFDSMRSLISVKRSLDLIRRDVETRYPGLLDFNVVFKPLIADVDAAMDVLVERKHAAETKNTSGPDDGIPSLPEPLPESRQIPETPRFDSTREEDSHDDED